MELNTNPLNIARIVLLVLGTIDVVRGLMHTWAVTYSATNIAGVIPACSSEPGVDDNIQTIMGAFGMSNLQTGIVNIFVAIYLPKLAPLLLLLIPTTYLIGTVGLKYVNGIKATADFNGMYMMIIYNIVSFMAGVQFLVRYGRNYGRN